MDHSFGERREETTLKSKVDKHSRNLSQQVLILHLRMQRSLYSALYMIILNSEKLLKITIVFIVFLSPSPSLPLHKITDKLIFGYFDANFGPPVSSTYQQSTAICTRLNKKQQQDQTKFYLCPRVCTQSSDSH